MRLRHFWVKVAQDPIVEYELVGRKILLNLSHDLPLNRAWYPQYSLNLGDIAAVIWSKYPTLHCIDIGANIGDSAIILSNRVQCPILCIEGESSYYSILEQNIADLPNAIPVNKFVNKNSDALVGTFQTRQGTANFVETATQDNVVQGETLEQILAHYPPFMSAKLLKLDTDGMDTLILRSNLEWLRVAKPVVFFEYAPTLLSDYDTASLELFGSLASAGYTVVMIYNNLGDYMFTAELDRTSVFVDLHYFILNHQKDQYYDLCVFHDEDREIANALRMQYIQIP